MSQDVKAAAADKAAWFGDRLRELREEAGLLQADLAERAGLTRGGVAQLETGLRRPQWETVIALVIALGVKCEAFMSPPAPRERPGPGRPPKLKPAASESVQAKKPQRKKGKAGR